MKSDSWVYIHRRSICFCIFVIALSGLWFSKSLPVSLFPRIDFPRIVVDVDAGDRPAEQMTSELTRLLEETMRLVPGVENIKSNTARGSATISVNFAWGQDMSKALLQVQASIAQIAPLLPQGTTFNIRHMAPELTPVLAFSLTSPKQSPVELQDIARYQLAPALTAIKGIQRVDVQGGEIEEYSVEVNPDKLNALNVTIAEVTGAIAANNLLSASGRLEDHYKFFLVMGESLLKDEADIKAIVVKSMATRLIHVSDLATVTKSVSPSWKKVTADGRPAVLMNIYQQANGNTALIAADVNAKMAELKSLLPKDVTVANWYDQSELILASVASVRDAILIGIILAAVVLMVFLRNVRLTLITVIIVPTVIAITILVMYLLGMSFNIMTLGGMAAAVGLIIDDVIVMLEHIERRLAQVELKDYPFSIFRAAREFTRPLIGSSLATLVIHIPPAFLSGATGGFFKALSLTMAIGLIISFFVTWLLTPILSSALLTRTLTVHELRGWESRLQKTYVKLLHRVLKKPILVLFGLVPLLAFGTLSFFKTGSGFMPEMDEGGFVLDYSAAPGTSLSETDRLIQQVEKILKETPDVATYSRRTGLGLGGGGALATNTGDFFVRLKSTDRRPIDAVMDDVREKVAANVPGLDVEILQLMEDLIGDLTAVPQPIEVKIYADDPRILESSALAVVKQLSTVQGLVDVKPQSIPTGETLLYKIDRQKAAMEGVDPENVSKVVSAALSGNVPTSILKGPKMVGIRVALPEKWRTTVDNLQDIQIRSIDGHLLPLRRIATFQTISGERAISRDNLKRMVAVTARLNGRDMGSAAAEVQSKLHKGVLGQGAYFQMGGLYAEQQRSFHEIEIVMLAAAALVFISLLYLYENFLMAFSALLMPLLAMPAVFIGLAITKTQLNISAMMGLTMIIGIVTEVGIFYFSELRDISPDNTVSDDNLVEAGINRLRPIMMTTLAAIFTLFPLALGLGEGAAMQQPLAIVTISGLLAQLPLVLLLMPVVYKKMYGISHSFS